MYKISFFSVAPCSGFYRTTLHPYKIMFQIRTNVSQTHSSLIGPYGLSLTKISEVCNHTVDYDYLVGMC